MNFILIDDDPVTNLINKKIIQIACGDKVKTITTFLNPEKALEYLKTIPFYKTGEYILFLDINMPEMNAWQFLDHLGNQNDFKINILSSSITNADLNKAENHKLVRDYIYKPLSVPKLKNVYTNLWETSLSA
ncbi:response regulator [Antarcticibacterium sp. 1MA-6-2]|uniref:response regulator n=1 Tax=Antarcticibacterium sp. 1MA-6-2 TaxID=2908210 RepID=UPI001F30095B|nr:response regulator [Antarcticibacterium sp. 1MA-6-2]UJH92713.1 response regulator [Antarcticibacterium sp. 1MA-6-2]